MYERFGFRSAGVRRRYYHDNGEDALIMWLEPSRAAVAERRARRRPVGASERSRARGRGLILALETSCDDTCAAVVDGAAIRSNVISSQAAAHAALRRRRAGGRLAPSPRAGRSRWSTRRSARPGSALEDVDSLAVTAGPGLIGALLVGVSTAKALAAATASRYRRSITCTATSRRTSSSRSRSSRRSSACSRAAATPCSPGCATTAATRSSGRRSTMPPARRSTRRPGCSGSAIPAAPRWSGWRRTATRRRSASRWR